MGQIESTKSNTATNAALGLAGIGNSVAARGLEAGKALDVNKAYNMNLLQLASELQGTKNNVVTDDMKGWGSQSGNQFGLTCCFIFLEALNGQLPWYIEIARYEHYTPVRKRGYKWMASFLVPAMQKSAIAKWAVNAVIVKPFLRYGAWLYKDKTAKRSSALLAPYCKTWLAVWGLLGKVV
jgi:hypothetical protein